MAIYQDLVDRQGFGRACNPIKRFVRQLREREPQQFDRLSFLLGAAILCTADGARPRRLKQDPEST